VRTVLDPDFRIGIKVGKYNGVALARGISGRYLRAQNYKNPKVRVGDTVWSANVPGGAFPTSKIGVVSKIIAGSGESLGQTLEITPSVDVTSLEQVYLLRLP
jgi:rod shape-determining protein MreC